MNKSPVFAMSPQGSVRLRTLQALPAACHYFMLQVLMPKSG